MPATRTAARRFEELTALYPAVAQVPLPGGDVSFVCRVDGGIAHVEIVDRAGQPLEPDAALQRLAGHRRNLFSSAEQMTEHALAHAALRQRDGDEVNLAELARELGVARQTVYNRLDDIVVVPARAAAA